MLKCRWLLQAGDFGISNVGSKCSAVATLAKVLPACIGTLPSAALPYSALHRVLNSAENAEAAATAQQGEVSASGGHAAETAAHTVCPPLRSILFNFLCVASSWMGTCIGPPASIKTSHVACS